jgi:hypothetical protein
MKRGKVIELRSARLCGRRREEGEKQGHLPNVSGAGYDGMRRQD